MGSSGSGDSDDDDDDDDGTVASSRNMAEVRPVRQPWSMCVAHQSSSSLSSSSLSALASELALSSSPLLGK